MSATEARKEQLAKIRGDLAYLERFVQSRPAAAMLSLRPDLEDAWTIQEHLVHLLDCEMVIYLWIRRALADPGTAMWPLGPHIEPEACAGQPVEQTVQAFKAVRLAVVGLLANVDEADFTRCFATRDTGKKWTVDDMASIMARHVGFHLEYIRRNEALWYESRRMQRS